MILVIGGIASGKRTYVHALGYDDAQIARAPSPDLPVLYGLEEVLREGPLDEEALGMVRAAEVVTCCEVGLGVVPMDADERRWRELVGRTCALLARDATEVVRMVCGIPVPLKTASTGATPEGDRS